MSGALKQPEALEQTDEPARRRIEAVWRSRADRLSQRPPAVEAGQDFRPVIVLGIGTERYGIDLSDVAEVLPPTRATPVPGAAVVVAGVINVHGEIRPVLDLRRLLDMDAVPGGERPRMILLNQTGRQMGLQIDSVEQIRWIGPRDLRTDGNSGRSRYIQAATNDLMMLLDTATLFAELQIGDTT
jgi:purine-binding chemotaxis protein CheW